MILNYFLLDACICQCWDFIPYLGRSHLQRLVVVSEISLISLPHRLHHQLGDRSYVQTCTNRNMKVSSQLRRLSASLRGI